MTPWLLLAWVGVVLAGWVAIVFPETRGMRQLNLDYEQSLPTWFSVVILALAGSLAFLSGWQQKGRDWLIVTGWMGSGLILLAMSADELVMVHEKMVLQLPENLRGVSYLTYPWVLAGAIVVVTVCALAVPFLLRLPRWTRDYLILSGAIFVGGALGVELLEAHNSTVYGWFSPIHRRATVVQEALEMLGVILAIDAILRYRRAEGLHVRL